MRSTPRRFNAESLPPLRGKTSQYSSEEKSSADSLSCPGTETRTQGGVLKKERVEQASRVMYISHVWTATYLQLRDPQSKDGRKRGEAAERSLWSLQCSALKCPRQTPAG